MSDTWQRLTYYPLRWIWFGGLHPDYNSKIATVHFFFNFSYFGLILVLAVIAIMMSYKDNIFNSVESILTIFLYLHIMGKYAILHFHKSTLSRLLAERSNFWNIDNFENDIKQETNNIVEKVLTFIKCYLGYSCLVASSYLIQPFVTGQLPVFLYVPPGWYYFLLFSFWYLTPSIVAGIWGVDTIFFSISTPIIVQLKLLAHKFENLKLNLVNLGDSHSSNQLQMELRGLIDYHNFLIWYCNEINRMASGIFLIQFLVAIAISCTQLFIASQNEFGIVNKFKCLSYFIMQIIETAIYCFTAELISETSADVGHAIYKASWYDSPDIDVKKDTAFVIIRSQKRVVFSGLGLVRINMETFTQVFKTSLSFYTYLNTMVYTD